MHTSKVLFVGLGLLTLAALASCGGSSESNDTAGGSTNGGTERSPEDFELGVLPFTFPAVEVNQGLSVALEGLGGTAPYTWVVSSGILPAWLSLSTSGTISGEPPDTEPVVFSIECTDTVGRTGQREYAFTPGVNSGDLASPSITSSCINSGKIGVSYSHTLSGVGGRLPYMWSLSAGALPDGLSLDSSSGNISGTPTSSAVTDIELAITDATLQTSTRTYTIVVIGGSNAPHGSDFNGDGYDDFIVGARLNDLGNTDAGAAYIFFGHPAGSQSKDDVDRDVLLVGADTLDWFGDSVSAAGDFNDDGFDDFIVGAPSDDDGGNEAGAAYIFFGQANPPSTIDASEADVTLIGEEADDMFGERTRSVGDVNGDGFDDVAVESNTADMTYVFFGSGNPVDVIDASDADIKISKPSGTIESGVGDVNGDGIDDLVMSDTEDDTGGVNAGSCYVFYGSTSLPSNLSKTGADIEIIGDNSGGDTNLGGISLIGDVNGDGFGDLGMTSVQRAFIIFGHMALPSSISIATADIELSVPAGIGAAGDINGDLTQDFALYTDGDTYLFFGSGTIQSISDLNDSAFVLDPGDNILQTGYGDLNGDGRTDIFRTLAAGNSGSATFPGDLVAVFGIHIFLGHACLNGTIHVSSSDMQVRNTVDEPDNVEAFGRSIGSR